MTDYQCGNCDYNVPEGKIVTADYNQWLCPKCGAWTETVRRDACSPSALNDGLDPLFPTRQDIEQMAESNPVLYRAIKMAEMQKVQTWAEVLQIAVKCLVEYSDAQNERMVKIVELSGKPFVIE